MGWILPTKCRVLNCSINGVDISQLLKTVKIFETVCKFYITGTLVVADNTNLIDNLGLKGGEPICTADVSAFLQLTADLQ